MEGREDARMGGCWPRGCTRIVLCMARACSTLPCSTLFTIRLDAGDNVHMDGIRRHGKLTYLSCCAVI